VKGLIDEVQIYNRALSADEIQAIFNAGSAGKCKAPADTTPPETTITGTVINVSSATFTFVSNEAGSTFQCQLDGGGFTTCTSPKSYTGLSNGSHTFQVRAIDPAGNVDPTPASFTWTVDTTPPVITGNVSPAPNGNGWNNSNVTVSWNVSDPESGIASSNGCGSSTLTTETSGTTLTCTATNGGGLSSSKSVTVKIDKTAPTVSGSRLPAPNGSGWNNTDVAASFTCTDGLSGIGSCGPTPQVLSAEGAGQSRTGTAVDKAGNTASTTVSGINIDKTAPTVTYSGNAGTYTIDQSVAITCAANDSLSGLASNTCANINGPAYTFTLGTNSFSASATDLAGNTGSGSTSFTVVVTYESLRSLTRQFVGQRGILNSLEAKLNAAEAAAARGNANAKQGAITAYINEVQAQSGKALTADQAAIL
jgi:hypothetical protein